MPKKELFKSPSTVSLGGTWFREGDFLVKREGDVAIGKAICFHSGDGVQYVGDPESKSKRVLLPDHRLPKQEKKTVKTVAPKPAKEVDHG